MLIFYPEQLWNILSKVSTFFSDNRSNNIHIPSSASKLIFFSLLSIIIPSTVESLLTLLANVSITMINR